MKREPLLLPVIAVAAVAFTALAAWFLKIDSSVEQTGYRGTGMEVVTNNKMTGALKTANVVPEPQEPAEEGGPKASEIYQNVKVLGHLNESQFNRIMAAVTEWVAPEQGCAYCHNEDGDFAREDNYAKIVARRMFQMTQHINEGWDKHVGKTGVTCYTCHRGKPVPQNIWFNEKEHPYAKRMLGNPMGQNQAGVEVAGYASLPKDPLSKYVEKDSEIRIIGKTPLPDGTNKSSIQDAEWTYSLMMHMSTSLGVNCTFCHNTRSFAEWDQSRVQRTTAWHGIRMLRDLNGAYLNPLKSEYPEKRLGPTGDAPKANCTTCHQGVNKPLYGANMMKDYLASLGSSKN